MKNVWKVFVAIFVLSLMIGGVTVSATSLAPAEEPFPVLTVKFGPAPEFEASAGAGVLALGDQDAMSGGDIAPLEAMAPAPEIVADSQPLPVQDGPILTTGGPQQSLSGPDLPDQSASNNVPEPSTLLLLGMGVLGILGFVRRRKNK